MLNFKHILVTLVALAAITNLNCSASDNVSSCAPPPANLVSWWKGESNALDVTGINNGALQGGVAFVPGEVGQAFNFNGLNSYVQVPDSPALRLTNALTIEFWARRTRLSPPIGEVLVEKGGDWTAGGENYGVIWDYAGNNYAVDFWFAGGTRSAGSIADTNWHHCAVVASNGAVDPVIYIDGVAQAITLRQGAGTINLYPSTKPLHIGAQIDPQTGINYYSQSMVDELSLYSRALSAAEVQAIYNAGAAGKCLPVTPPSCDPPPAGLVSWWKGETNTLDLVSGNNGTAVGSLQYGVGEVGSGFAMNGSGYVSVPASPSLNIGATGGGVTIECWINPATAAEIGPMTEWDSSSMDGLQFWVQPPLFLFANLKDTSGVNHVIQSAPNTVATNAWQHAALTYDKASGAALIYLNGAVIVSNNFGSLTPQTTYPLNIGRRTGQIVGLNQTFTGGLDEVSLYNRALSSAEVQAIYNAGAAGKCAPRLWCVPDLITTATNTATQFAAAKLALNDVDLDGYPLTVTGVSAASSQGGAVALASGQVTYAPHTGFMGNDTFTYTVSDGHGGTAMGVVTAMVGPIPVSLNIVFGPVIAGGNFVVGFAGIPGLTYTIEAAPTLAGPWTKVANLTAPTTNQGQGIGGFSFSEPVNGNTARFYRTVYPAY